MNWLKIALVLVILMGRFGVNAQGFDAHLTLGLVGSQIDGDGFGGYNKAGPLVSMGLSVPLKKKWDLLWEVGYIQKGSRLNNPNALFQSIRLNYLELPLYVRYRVYQSFSLSGGVGVAYLISGKQSLGFDYQNFTEDLTRIEASGMVSFAYLVGQSTELFLRQQISLSNAHKFTWWTNRLLVFGAAFSALE